MQAIIIDDERHCIDSLSIMLQKYTEVTVLQTYENALDAAKELGQLDADILFLDIEMPYINGFELLTMFPSLPMKIVFTTAYNEYAIKAFKFNAVDYLMKPIMKEDLINAIFKIKKNIEDFDEKTKPPNVFNDLLHSVTNQIKKIAIPTLSGLEMIQIEDICYLESYSNYCHINMISDLRRKTYRIQDP